MIGPCRQLDGLLVVQDALDEKIPVSGYGLESVVPILDSGRVFVNQSHGLIELGLYGLVVGKQVVVLLLLVGHGRPLSNGRQRKTLRDIEYQLSYKLLLLPLWY